MNVKSDYEEVPLRDIYIINKKKCFFFENSDYCDRNTKIAFVSFENLIL